MHGVSPESLSRVDAAFAVVPRAAFLARRDRRQSAVDQPIRIGHGQTNSQPTTVRNMLALLDVRPGDRVLDVGSGSGWTTALLAELTGPTGRVYGVELVPELAEFGKRNLADFLQTVAHQAGVRSSSEADARPRSTNEGDAASPQSAGEAGSRIGWASISPAAPDVLGLPNHAPYERILVSAEARQLPQALVDQLAPGGRLVIPVAGRLAVVEHTGNGQIRQRRVGHYAFVPLR